MEDQMSDNAGYRRPCVRAINERVEVTKALVPPFKQRKLGVLAGKRRSLVWQHYDIIDDEGKLRAVCKYCDATNYRAEGYFGTTNCRKHLTNCTAYKRATNQNLLTDKTDCVSNDFDEKVYCQLFAEAIVLHGCPSSIIENEGLRKLFAYLNPKAKNVSSSAVKKIVEESTATPRNGIPVCKEEKIDCEEEKKDGVIVINDSDADAESLLCYAILD